MLLSCFQIELIIKIKGGIMKKLAIIPFILLFGCASTGGPKWADNPKCKKRVHCAVGIAETDIRAVSVTQATKMALAEITTLIESDNDVRSETAIETAGRDAGLFFQQVSRTQASVMLRDLKASRQETSRKGRYYTAYVLLEVDKGALRERELEELQKNDEIYQKLSGTKLIDEMKAEMNEYRKSKGK